MKFFNIFLACTMTLMGLVGGKLHLIKSHVAGH